MKKSNNFQSCAQLGFATFTAVITFTATIFPNLVQGGIIDGYQEAVRVIEETVSDGVTYALDIIDEENIVNIAAFAVSNNASGNASSDRDRWDGDHIEASVWDDGFSFTLGDNSYTSTDFGDFQSLFGADLYVNFFINEDLANPITSENDEIVEFFFNNSASSEFIAINSDGQIVDQSNESSIPEPTSLALLGLGLVGLIGFGLKNRSKECERNNLGK